MAEKLVSLRKKGGGKLIFIEAQYIAPNKTSRAFSVKKGDIFSISCNGAYDITTYMTSTNLTLIPVNVWSEGDNVTFTNLFAYATANADGTVSITATGAGGVSIYAMQFRNK